MSTSCEIDSNNYICGSESRLTFGIPLEDVSPRGDIHPSLKCLFKETYKQFILAYEACPLECLINKLKITRTIYINDIITALTYNMPLPSILSFESLMHTLRYFLGSLPIPLLPKYTNYRDFQWVQLSSQCRSLIEQRFMNKQLDNKLKDDISIDLLRLPRVNLLLIGYFVNFLRSLVRYGKHAQRYNKKAANILINYFSSSIFSMPYNKNQSKKYHPLMLFMIVKWPHIQQRCVEIQPQCFQAKPPVYFDKKQRKETTSSVVSTVSNFKNDLHGNLSTIQEIDESSNCFIPKVYSTATKINSKRKLIEKELKSSSCQIITKDNLVSVYTQTYNCEFTQTQNLEGKKQIFDIGVQTSSYKLKDDLDHNKPIEKSPGIKSVSNKLKKSLSFQKRFSLENFKFLSGNKKSSKNSYVAGDYGNKVLDFPIYDDVEIKNVDSKRCINEEIFKQFNNNEDRKSGDYFPISSTDESFNQQQTLMSNNTLNTFIDKEEVLKNILPTEENLKENERKSVSDTKSLPRSINSNTPETHVQDHSATDPLNDQCKRKKSPISFTKFKTSLSFIKQIKNCGFIKRVRSEEFFKRNFTYIKMPSKKFFTMP